MTGSARLYNVTELQEVSRNNPDFVKKMVQLTMNEFIKSTSKIMEAYALGDFDNVKFYAHRLKPSVISMKIDGLKDDISRIEAAAINQERTPVLTEMIQKLNTIMTEVIAQMKADYNL